MKLALNGVQVAPFGLKLCQNDAPDLRIILEALLVPKTVFKNKKEIYIYINPEFYRQELIKSNKVWPSSAEGCRRGEERPHISTLGNG